MIAVNNLKEVMADSTFPVTAQKVFFDAMNAGYSAKENPAKGTIAELPGSKTITYTQGPWKVVDTYFVTPASDWSGGTTVIWYEGVPVWMMQYFGMYKKHAIPFLKMELRHAYSTRQFIGGRGVGFHMHLGYTYTNHLAHNSNFQLFSGREHVEGPEELTSGWHQYHGGMMV